MKSPLQLKKVSLRRLLLETAAVRDAPMPNEPAEPLNVVFGVQKHREENWFKLPFELIVHPPERPDIRRIHLTMEFTFALPKSFSEEKTGLYVPTACLANAFSLARGVIAQATLTCDEGAYWLPLINVEHLLRSARERNQEKRGDSTEVHKKALPGAVRKKATTGLKVEGVKVRIGRRKRDA